MSLTGVRPFRLLVTAMGENLMVKRAYWSQLEHVVVLCCPCQPHTMAFCFLVITTTATVTITTSTPHTVFHSAEDDVDICDYSYYYYYYYEKMGWTCSDVYWHKVELMDSSVHPSILVKQIIIYANDHHYCTAVILSCSRLSVHERTGTNLPCCDFATVWFACTQMK